MLEIALFFMPKKTLSNFQTLLSNKKEKRKKEENVNMSQITVLKHSSIHIQAKEGTIYIDTYLIEEASHDA